MQLFRHPLPRRRPLRLVASLLAWGLAGAVVGPAGAFAQTVGTAVPAELASLAQRTKSSAENAATAAELGRLQGEVTDLSGALIPGARLSLRLAGSPAERTVRSDSEGRFAFAGLPPGEYLLIAGAPGFQTWTSTPIPLTTSDEPRWQDVVLTIPANHADAYVTLSQRQIASAELHTAEQQRIVGFPDFYTSFVWNAAPLDTRQKLSLGLHATTDRMAFVTAGLVATGEQIRGTFPGYGGGRQGFGKRYGAAYADGFIGKFVGGAVLPSLFRQDPRYFYMGPKGTLKQRVRHAVLSGFLARGDNGRTELNYSHILGNAGAGALSTLYHPAAESAGKLALNNALLGTLGEAAVNVTRELFLKRFVRGGDPDANGMP